MTLKEKYWAWYNAHIVKGFYKSWAWLTSVASLLIAYGPDAATFVLEHADLIQTGLPSLPPALKSLVLLVAHGIIFFVRPLKQKSMPPAVVEVPVIVTTPAPGEPWPQAGKPEGTESAL
jgi:hypothetical protein